MICFVRCLAVVISFCTLTHALLCHQCSHQNSRETARLKMHDRVRSSPWLCDQRRVCEGKWCVQNLVGGNVTFGCSDYTPLQLIWQAEDITSHCTASFDADSVSHATCWCRLNDFCNSSLQLRPPFYIVVCLGLSAVIAKNSHF